MLKIVLISVPRLAVLLCLCASGIGVRLASAQHYHSVPGARSYTQITRPSPAWPTQGNHAARWTGTTRQSFTVASQPTVTTIQAAAASAPPPVSPATQYVSQPAHPWPSGPVSVSSPSGWPVSYAGTACPDCTGSGWGRRCDWFCQAQKKLRSFYRASHRRCECKFEYPVSMPGGCPYGYVEPTWSEFCAQPGAHVIEPYYPGYEH